MNRIKTVALLGLLGVGNDRLPIRHFSFLPLVDRWMIDWGRIVL